MSDYVQSTTAMPKYADEVNEIVANYSSGYEDRLRIEHSESDKRIYVTASGLPELVDGLMQEINDLGKTDNKS